jgi:hypothetical protein
MKTLLDRLIEQLNTLVPFLSLSREDVFQILNDHRLTWFAANEEALPEAYAAYRKQINHSAILLGYSYFESFLVDLLTQIFRHRPAMLPRERKVDYSEILDSLNKSALMDKLIRRELHEFFYKSMEDIIKELRKRYNFTITEEEEDRLIQVSLIRNCIIHNSSRADSRLSQHAGFLEGNEFELSAADAHSYGIALRSLVRRMYDEARTNHRIQDKQNASVKRRPARRRRTRTRRRG